MGSVKCRLVMVLALAFSVLAQPQIGIPLGTLQSGRYLKDDGTFGSPGGVPAGVLVFVVSGSCPTGWTEEVSLNGKTLFGTLNANADVGTTGGSDNVTPAGTNSAPAFTGTAATLSHSGTAISAHSGTAVANHAFTQPTAAWPVGVPTAAGDAATAATGSSGAAKPTATHTHTISWPVGVPTNSGGAVDAHTVTQPANHTVTQPSDHSYTPTGSVAAPTFTGTGFDNRSAFVKVIFCKKS